MSDTTPIRPGALNWALLNLLSLVWGTAFLSIGISIESLPPLTTAAARVSVAGNDEGVGVGVVFAIAVVVGRSAVVIVVDTERRRS